MKTLKVLTEGVKGSTIQTKKVGRSKLIFESSEFGRPEYIEVDNFKGMGHTYEQRDEPLIRVHFEDDKQWVGTISELRKKLL